MQSKEEKRARERGYYTIHREEILVRNKRWRIAHREKMIAYYKKYRAIHKEEIAAQKKEYRIAHREEEIARGRKYRVIHKKEQATYAREYYAIHKEKIAARNKKWRTKNKDYANRYRRNYSRQKELGTNGKRLYGLNKRLYTGSCELCGRANGRLAYHHWDDDNYNLGIWVCLPCHCFVEQAEKGITVENYFNLKKKVEAEIVGT